MCIGYVNKSITPLMFSCSNMRFFGTLQCKLSTAAVHSVLAHSILQYTGTIPVRYATCARMCCHAYCCVHLRGMTKVFISYAYNSCHALDRRSVRHSNAPNPGSGKPFATVGSHFIRLSRFSSRESARWTSFPFSFRSAVSFPPSQPAFPKIR